jgi:hypothetical protein
MSPGPDDTLPPASGSAPTLPPSRATATLPPDPPSAGSLPPIPRGEAQQALSAALDDLVRAYRLVEAVGMACARQLDAEGK